MVFIITNVCFAPSVQRVYKSPSVFVYSQSPKKVHNHDLNGLKLVMVEVQYGKMQLVSYCSCPL